jgi:hypothetical protein
MRSPSLSAGDLLPDNTRSWYGSGSGRQPIDEEEEGGGGEKVSSSRLRGILRTQPQQHTRRSHVPTDSDTRSISSHAQAEALVQRAQQSILDMYDNCGVGVVDHDDDGGGDLNGGRWGEG